MRDDRDGALTGPRLRGAIPDWSEARVWVCAPAAFGKALCGDLAPTACTPQISTRERVNMR